MQEEKLQTCKNLSDALRDSGFSRAEFALKAEITEASLFRYLNGKAEPRSAELLRMAKTLGVSMEWLISGKTGNRDPAFPIVREGTSGHGTKSAPPPQALSEIDRRLTEVIQELQQLKRDISKHRN